MTTPDVKCQMLVVCIEFRQYRYFHPEDQFIAFPYDVKTKHLDSINKMSKECDQDIRTMHFYIGTQKLRKNKTMYMFEYDFEYLYTMDYNWDEEWEFIVDKKMAPSYYDERIIDYENFSEKFFYGFKRDKCGVFD